MASVRLSNVGKWYDARQIVVDDASFEVADGELMVLVGPSGCGKSTILRMIAGLEEISSGSLYIGERLMNDVAPRDRDIAMVFQNYALYPHMTAAENLAFGLKLRGFDKAEIARRVHAAAKTLGLDSMLEKLPKAMSGGQRQRVALGRALVREPSVFLLDEPLSNLDAKLRHSMRTEIARLHRKLGATMIYVTHDQVEAMTLGQRIVVLNDGKIQQIDTPMGLYDRPVNLFVAGFLGSPAMNVLKGRIERLNDWVFRLSEETVIPLNGLTVPESWTNREVLMGVRPEFLHPATADEPAFPARVDVVEPVGNEIFLNLILGSIPLIARIPPAGEALRDAVIPMAIDHSRIHFFDAHTELRLTRES